MEIKSLSEYVDWLNEWITDEKGGRLRLIELAIKKHGVFKINNFSELKWSYFYKSVIYYNNFLKQDLLEPYKINGVMAHPLNRFVACDLEGNALEEPLDWKNPNSPLYTPKECREYQEAKDRILMSGKPDTVYISRYGSWWNENTEERYETIGDLVGYDLIITESAKKYFNLSF